MGHTIDKSVPDWTIIPGVQAPEDAPNILVVFIDDAGSGNRDTFGGPIRTPNLTRVKEMESAIGSIPCHSNERTNTCSLLTGRNQHRVGFGSVSEFPGPFPGYSTSRPKVHNLLPYFTRNGYVTGGFGKWHLTPDNVQGAAGPFERGHYHGDLTITGDS